MPAKLPVAIKRHPLTQSTYPTAFHPGIFVFMLASTLLRRPGIFINTSPTSHASLCAHANFIHSATPGENQTDVGDARCGGAGIDGDARATPA